MQSENFLNYRLTAWLINFKTTCHYLGLWHLTHHVRRLAIVLCKCVMESVWFEPFPAVKVWVMVFWITNFCGLRVDNHTDAPVRVCLRMLLSSSLRKMWLKGWSVCQASAMLVVIATAGLDTVFITGCTGLDRCMGDLISNMYPLEFSSFSFL